MVKSLPWRWNDLTNIRMCHFRLFGRSAGGKTKHASHSVWGVLLSHNQWHIWYLSLNLHSGLSLSFVELLGSLHADGRDFGPVSPVLDRLQVKRQCLNAVLHEHKLFASRQAACYFFQCAWANGLGWWLPGLLLLCGLLLRSSLKRLWVGLRVNKLYKKVWS